MGSPSLDFLASRAFPELASAVRAVLEPAIARWDAAVRAVLPKAHPMTLDQLRDDMPNVLSCIADALESDRRFEIEAFNQAAPDHGGVRYEQGYNTDELLIEYSLLRASLFTELSAHMRRSLAPDEIQPINAAMDVAVRRSVVRYVEHLTGQLQSSTEAQSKYLSFLSHDLRGGLNGVFLMIEVLKRELAGETRLTETLADLDVMRRALLETVGTMDRFLHAERFRKGKVQVHAGEVNLRNVLTETAAHFAYQSRDKGIELRVDAPIDCAIVSDKELLSLIFQNLVSNAIKYSEKGTEVTIAAGACQEGGCEVSVVDRGPGIAPEQLEGLFSAFARGDTHGQPGVGLGLTIARQAAEYLGARLWAESVPGEGSTFIVQLPKSIAK